jgi:uncharacterized membrane protein YphA (DoxX/SURF4 family)
MDPSTISSPAALSQSLLALSEIPPALLLTLRFSFALLLAAAAMHKLRDIARFRATLVEYDVLPAGVARAAAPGIALAEASLAAMLTAGLALEAAAASVSILMLAYAAAIYTNVARGRTGIDCGCMGPAARVPVSSALVLRNLLLAAAASMMLVLPPAAARHWMDAVSAVAATLALSACWLASERMLALAPRAAELRSRGRRPR